MTKEILCETIYTKQGDIHKQIYCNADKTRFFLYENIDGKMQKKATAKSPIDLR